MLEWCRPKRSISRSGRTKWNAPPSTNPRDYNCGEHLFYIAHKYPYLRTTVDTTSKINRIQNTPFDLAELRCGPYFLGFSVKAARPATYSKRKQGGTPETGQVNITNTKNIFSIIEVDMHFFNTRKQRTLTTDTATSNVSNALKLSCLLFALLTNATRELAITQTQSTVLQQKLNTSLPTLLNELNDLKYVVQNATADHIEKQRLLGVAKAYYQLGLNVWLPLLFLLPLIAAIGIHILRKTCYKPSEVPAVVLGSDAGEFSSDDDSSIVTVVTRDDSTVASARSARR